MVRLMTARDRVRVAEEVTAELRAVLGERGIILPSLRLDPVSCASSVMGPLVELGRCNLAVARQLTEVLTAGVPCCPQECGRDSGAR
jgi:hypothetical protein